MRVPWRHADGRDRRPGAEDDGAGARTVTLDESYERCRELNRRHGTTYYWATFVLPRVKRHHVHALYGFCRYADDIVDEPVRAADGTDPTAARPRPWPPSATRFFADLDRGGATTRC